MPREQDHTQTEPFRRSARSPSSEVIDARFLRSMLYEPLPGSAAVILAQLGIIEEGQIEALGARTYDAESARLSLALDDGRTVELERAMHLHTENGYAVRIRSRAGQTISRSFIHIDRDLGVRNLHNDRMVYIDDTDFGAGTAYNPADAADTDLSEAEIEAAADHAHESQTRHFHTQSADARFEHPDPEPAVMSVDEAITASVEVASVELARAEEQTALQPQSSEPESATALTGEANPESIRAAPTIGEAVANPQSSESEAAVEAETLAALEEPAITSETLSLAEASKPENSFGEAVVSEEPVVADVLLIADEASLEPQTAVATIAPEFLASAEAEVTTEETVTIVELAAADFTAAPAPVIAEHVSAEAVAAAVPESAVAVAETQPAEPDASEPGFHLDYAPLHAALTPAEAADFLFVAQTGTIHTYEHRQTFRYIHIDAPSGLFYDQTRTPISRIAALKRALTPQSSQPSAVRATSEESTSAPAAEAKDHVQFEAHLQAKTDPQPIPSTAAHPEPELRVRTTYAARAAVKPEPVPESQLTPSDQAPSFDAFTRKHGSPLDRDSWRDRVAGLRSALRLGRNANSSNGEPTS